MPRGSKNTPEGAPLPSAAVRTISSTEAQNNFGQVLSQALHEGMVLITKYGAEAAVVLSIDRFRELVPATEPNLDDLTREFNEMVARMQTPEAAAAADAVFGMTTDELADAAVGAVDRRCSA